VTTARVSIDHVTDAELVARARQGDQAAFGELVARHQTAVHRAALSAGTPPGDADDVAQDAFLLAYRRLGSFRGEASFKTWLLTITWNQAINHRRSQSRWWRYTAATGSREDEGLETLPVADTASTPEEAAATGELARQIAQAIRQLPHRLRDPLLLAQSGEYSYDEIGAILDAPVGTIKSRVFEARRAVRQALDARGVTNRLR
jgi:RNA polymerase sigma-70 factor (ECF subfamily)